ncbi:MAG: hypothetical protein KGJ80_19420, partial [Chloroflexota bacterium]|nr:hypothetical protein [Chloroflexota bacterium]
ESNRKRLLWSLWLAEGFDVLGWLALGLGFWFTLRTLSSLSWDPVPYCIAVMIFSMLTGLAVIFAPNGYGVRELTISVLLQPILPIPLTIILAFLSRIILIAVDLSGVIGLLAMDLWRGSD